MDDLIDEIEEEIFLIELEKNFDLYANILRSRGLKVKAPPVWKARPKVISDDLDLELENI